MLIATRTEHLPIKDTIVSHVIVKGSSRVLFGLGFGFVGGDVRRDDRWRSDW